jgi:GPH family glycoside/pentoside/hexuronide:cation symporter
VNAQRLSFGQQLAYACGMMGWSILINLISVILIYLYLPPANSGLPALISQVAIFGIFNFIALITAGGRFIDAIYDPLIAQYSDRNKNPKGRRIPLMKLAIIPSTVFCCLIFFPLQHSESTLNIIWLSFVLLGFYISSTTYIIPYSALLPELAHNSEEKVKLATWQSAGYVFGIGIASNAFNIANVIKSSVGSVSKIEALQYTIVILAVLAAFFMFITVFAIDEKKHSSSKPSAVPLKAALKQALANPNFRLFIIADFSYFIAVTIITSGLIYFVTVLLQLEEKIGNLLMITMVLVSFAFYPVVNVMARKFGKKPIVVLSLFLLAVIFAGITFFGQVNIDPYVQVFGLIAFAAIPLATLNILPSAILAEIIEKDSIETGENKEALYYAVKYFFVKIAQTFGIALFSMLLLYGKDIGNDWGIRLNGWLGFVLCILAGLAFSRFRERK